MNIEKLMRDNTKLREENNEFRAENSRMFELISQLYEILIWCGGSSDFLPEGKARIGWENGAMPILERVRKYLEYAKDKFSNGIH